MDTKKQIRETRRARLGFVTVGPAELKRIGDILKEEARRTRDVLRLTYKILTVDGSSFESEESALFERDNLPNGDIEEVSMNLVSPATEIGLMLRENQDGYIEVAGYDSTWVNGIMERLQREVEACQNRHKFFHTRWNALTALVVLGLAFFSLIMLGAKFIESTDVDRGIAAFAGVILCLPFLWAFSALVDYLKATFPKIEIIGRRPSKSQRRRTAMWTILTLLVLPIAINILCSFLR